eukprot:TRINITY_DN3711_c0_g1_i1.p1 TRINITY_DN3711_c0_g1~~TRINITY_DN3711_c0_g1_i1.p1  ORF type:complete len:883 (-),score=203.97 TRINITY_DN3711_c0_g1_i1:7-2655(-)
MQWQNQFESNDKMTMEKETGDFSKMETLFMENSIELQNLKRDHGSLEMEVIVDIDLESTTYVETETEMETEIKDINMLGMQLLTEFTGKEEMGFIQRNFKKQFLWNLILVMRIVVGTVITSILISIPQINQYLSGRHTAVIICVLSACIEFGAALRELFTLVAIMVTCSISVAFTQIFSPSFPYTSAIYVFLFSFIVGYARYPPVIQQLAGFILVYIVLRWTYQMYIIPDPTFSIVIYGLKLGATCLLGYAVLIFASLFPFPTFATKRVNQKLHIAIKSFNLLLKELSLLFDDHNRIKLRTQRTHIKSLIDITEENMAQIKKLLPSVQMENPLSSLQGYEKMIDLMRIFLMNAKGMYSCLEYFSCDNPLSNLRHHISLDFFKVATRFSEALLVVFDRRGVAPFAFTELINSMEKLKNSFKNQRKIFVKVAFPTPRFNEKEKEKINLEQEEETEEGKMDQDTPSLNDQDNSSEKPQEMSATYLSIFSLLEACNRLVELKTIPFITRSYRPLIEGIKEPIFYAWGLSSTKHDKILSYLKSKIFRGRILHAFLYATTMMLSCLPAFIPKIASKFYGSYPINIAVTVTFIFGTTTDTSYQHFMVRMGGTFLGTVFSFLALEIVVGGNSWPVLVVVISIFIAIMAFLYTDYKDTAQVASYITIVNFYTIPITEKGYDVFVLDTLIQTFWGALIILVVFSVEWIANSTRKKLYETQVDTFVSIEKFFDEATQQNSQKIFDSEEHLTQNLLVRIKEVDSLLIQQRTYIECLKTEPLLWRHPIALHKNFVISTIFEEISEEIYWIEKCSNILNSKHNVLEKQLLNTINPHIKKMNLEISACVKSLTDIIKNNNINYFSKYQPWSSDEVIKLGEELDEISKKKSPPNHQRA